jgi:hypothetical protein
LRSSVVAVDVVLDRRDQFGNVVVDAAAALLHQSSNRSVVTALGVKGLEVLRATSAGRWESRSLISKRPVHGRRFGRADPLEDIISESELLDITGRLRSPAATPGHWAGCVPPNKGLRYPADPPTIEAIILVMRQAGPGPYADRIRGLIAVL